MENTKSSRATASALKTKDTQGKLWSTSPHDWARLQEPTFIPLYKAVLQQLPLTKKSVLLDAGCGSGLFAHIASYTGAKIYGIDAAPGLLELTKLRVPQGLFMLEDLEDISFGENSFDVVTGFNSFQYAGDKIAAMSQAKRVVKKGGKIVIGLWDEAKHCDASTVFASIAALFPLTAVGAPGPFALSAEGVIEKMCEQLLLTILHKEKIFCPWLFTSKEDLFSALLCTGPAVKASETLGIEKVKEIIETSAEPYRLADEIYFLQNYFHYYIIEK